MLGMVRMDHKEVRVVRRVRMDQMAQDRMVHRLKLRKDHQDLLDQEDLLTDPQDREVSDHHLVQPPFKRCWMRTAP